MIQSGTGSNYCRGTMQTGLRHRLKDQRFYAGTEHAEWYNLHDYPTKGRKRLYMPQLMKHTEKTMDVLGWCQSLMVSYSCACQNRVLL